MPSHLTEEFVHALKPHQGERRLYDRAANMTSGVLVVDEDSDATSLVQACFEKRFPVAVELARFDPQTPRIETDTEQVIGEANIHQFLKRV